MPSRPSAQRREALRLLGLEDPVDRAEVIRAFRRLARQHHPDRGGDPETFRALAIARDVLLADALAGRDSDPGSTSRVVVMRQRPARRIVRGLRRRLGRTGGERRHLE